MQRFGLWFFFSYYTEKKSFATNHEKKTEVAQIPTSPTHINLADYTSAH